MTDFSNHTGLLLVVSGPSGVGKTTIVRELRTRLPDACFSVSATTRAKTAADTEGADYYFLTVDKFQQRAIAGDFLEHAQYAGNRYGTLQSEVNNRLTDGKTVLLDIDVQGARSVKALMPESLTIFIKPPSEGVLLQRLRGRGRDSEAVIQRRFAEATHEIQTAETGGFYDAHIVNDTLETAIETILSLVASRRTA